MEPFTSNDTYACPDCGSEVKVGARSCPGCGPFRPVDWQDDETEEEVVETKSPFHSMTTYTDTREVLERSQHPLTQPPVMEAAPVEEKPTRFLRIFLLILLGLTTVSGGMAALRLYLWK